MTSEPEPNGWELMRGIKDLRTSIDAIGSGMVSQALFTTVVDRVAALEAEQQDQRKTRAQQWFAIGMAILGLVCTIVAGVVVFTLTMQGMTK